MNDVSYHLTARVMHIRLDRIRKDYYRVGVETSMDFLLFILPFLEASTYVFICSKLSLMNINRINFEVNRKRSVSS